MADTTHDDGAWYWDLERREAVPASERKLSTNMLGPYASKAEAERWQQQVDARNEAWDDDDDDWNNPAGGDDDD